MKKNSFMEGAMIATIAIIISKIIGLIYVIPFYSLIGSQGGALYGYGYSIYAIFLSLSVTGIPTAISKLVSEYNTLGYYNTKERVYKVGTMIIFSLSFVMFLTIMLFAKDLAFMIIGNIKGGNSIESVTMVIRVVATALLIVPFLSVTRGYLQGHKFITPSSISIVIEQIVRVVVILGGSFFALRVFHLSLDTAIGISIFGATVGAITAYMYLFYKIRKNKEKLKTHEAITRAEYGITLKMIAKKIIFYAIPFIIIDLVKSSASFVDTLTMVKTLYSLGYSIKDTEIAFGVITTWASKLNMIVIAVVLGIDISLIPHLASSHIKNDFKDISRKVNKSLQVILYTVLPMTIGIYFLAQPVWVIFYGYNQLSIDIFRVFIFSAIAFSFFYILLDTLQTLNDTKATLGALFGGFLFKVFMNVPIMQLCHYVGIPAYYGPIITNLIMEGIVIGYILYVLNKKYQVHYGETIKNSFKIIICVGVMYMILTIISLFIKVDATNRLAALIETVFYSGVGLVVYAYISYCSGLMIKIFGQNFLDKILIRLHLKKA